MIGETHTVRDNGIECFKKPTLLLASYKSQSLTSLFLFRIKGPHAYESHISCLLRFTIQTHIMLKGVGTYMR